LFAYDVGIVSRRVKISVALINIIRQYAGFSSLIKTEICRLATMTRHPAFGADFLNAGAC
jgi:hypothetical protein